MGKNKTKQQQKKQIKKQTEHNSRQQEKQDERKSKRERRKEKNKFNKAKYESDMTKFRVQLHQYGLKVKEMGADGNCLFRAIADQLEGNEKLHRKYRQEAVDYIEQNKESYAPFIEDDETIDQYLGDMCRDGVWGGQLELQVLSLIHQFNFIIHQVDNPIMAFSNFPWGSVPTLHVSYHLGEHYNSVRLMEDPGDGPLMPIGHELKIKHPIVVQEIEKEEAQKENTKEEKPTREQLIQYAITITGLSEYEIMEKTLLECFGKDLSEVSTENIIQTVDAITKSYEDIEIKLLQSDLNNKLQINDNDSSSTNGSISTSQSNQNGSRNSQANSLEEEEKKLAKLKTDNYMLGKEGQLLPMPAMNKNCPCQSKRKYKNCCYSQDLSKKTEYIEKQSKKLNEAQQLSKNKSILML